MSKDVGIVRLTKWIKGFCLAALVLIPLSSIYSWWYVFELERFHNPVLNFPVNFELVMWYQWLAAIGLSCVPIGIKMWAIRYVYRLMRLFQKAEYFSRKTSRNLYQFSFWLLMGTIAKIICDALTSAVLTYTNSSGRLFVIGLDDRALSTLFIVSIFFVITRIMNEGIRLAEENAEFV